MRKALAFLTPLGGARPLDRRTLSWFPVIGALVDTADGLLGHMPRDRRLAVMAAFAASLDLRLGGGNRYGDRIELRPPMGDGRPPERDDITRAVRLSGDTATLLASVLLADGTAAGWWYRARGATR